MNKTLLVIDSSRMWDFENMSYNNLLAFEVVDNTYKKVDLCYTDKIIIEKCVRKLNYVDFETASDKLKSFDNITYIHSVGIPLFVDLTIFKKDSNIDNVQDKAETDDKSNFKIFDLSSILKEYTDKELLEELLRRNQDA